MVSSWLRVSSFFCLATKERSNEKGSAIWKNGWKLLRFAETNKTHRILRKLSKSIFVSLRVAQKFSIRHFSRMPFNCLRTPSRMGREKTILIPCWSNSNPSLFHIFSARVSEIKKPGMYPGPLIWFYHIRSFDIQSLPFGKPPAGSLVGFLCPWWHV